MFSRSTGFRFAALLMLIILCFSAFGATPARAASIVVNTANDTDANDGSCSLREAINNANSDSQTYSSAGECASGSGADTITFDSSLSGGTVTLGSALPALSADVTIDGSSLASQITISGNNAYRVFFVNSSVAATFDNLIIAAGNGSGNGGGGIYDNGGTLTVANSTFSGNTTSGWGGGIYNENGTLTLTSSTFTGNSAVNGGAVTNFASSGNSATATISNSTFSGNSASSYGGAIYDHASNNGSVASATVTNATIVQNSAASDGGGVAAADPGAGGETATLTLQNSIVYRNTSPSSNLNCYWTNAGASLLGDANNLFPLTTSGDSCPAGASDITTSAALYTVVGSLADNGGFSQTRALISGSPAMDAGRNTTCATPSINNLDQRGVVRPFDGNGDSTATCDIGAYEYEYPQVTSITRDDLNPTNASSVDFTATFSQSVTGVDATDFTLTVTGVSGATVSGVSGSGSSYTVTVNTGSGNGTIRLDVADDDSIIDSLNSPLGGAGDGSFTSGEVYTVDKTPLAAPVLTSPSNGSAPLTLRPAFDWADSIGATKYNLQISRNNIFTQLVINVTTLPSNFTPGANLPANITLYWRVRAMAATPGPWSSVWSFTAPNPPSTPSLFVPPNNGLTTDYTPLLDWANSAVPLLTSFDHYQVQVDDNSDFSSPMIDAPTTTSDYTPGSDLAPNKKYYWRVQAFNNAGQYSAWSSIFAFRTALLPPSLNNPADTAALLNKRPTFDWNPVTGASSYNIQVSRNLIFNRLVLNTNSTPATFTPGADLPAATVLYWRVRSNGTNGPGSWSETRSFTTGNPASTPSLFTPPNNGLTTDYTPLLDWSNSTLPFFPFTAFDHYQLQVDDNSDFSSLVIDSSTATGDIMDSDYTPASDLNPNTKYYWRVQAFNNAGEYSAWSAVRYFRTALLAPNSLTPGNVYPVPGGAPNVQTRRPTFTWGTVAGATSYTVEYSIASNFSSRASATVSTALYTPGADLSPNTIYYWRVRANGTNGPSLYSQVRTFTTGNPPSIPNLISPANNLFLNSTTVSFDWSDSTVPANTSFDHYEIEISTVNTFASTAVDTTLINSDYESTSELSENTTYYWRVRSVNDVGDSSTWSVMRTVKIGFSIPTVTLQTFATGFSSPVFVTNANDSSGRIFVVEKCGTIKIIESGNTLATDFLDISGRVDCSGERGLLSMAFPPNYSSKHYFYVFYADVDGTLTVSRFSVPNGTPDQADASSEQVILTIAHPNTNHNGGQLAFGNDGYLYISTGDGGGAGDTSNNAQNPNVLLGKILRIDVESGVSPYSIPATNPFYGVSGKRAEIWSMGLRNPWRFSFDRQTHGLYIGDVGQDRWEEVDVRPASSSGGENYGWRLREGNHCYNPSSGCGTPLNYVAPVTEYSHTYGCAVTGGYVYRGSTYPALQGFYIYSDYCSGRIWVLKQANGIWYSQEVADSGTNPSSFGEDEQGNLYLVDLGGTIYTVETSP